MAQKTNLNAAPYFDDFNAENNYHKILFRPGYAVQARELTQLQSALQHQIEAHGSHIFREGSMIVPGQGSMNRYYSVKLASTFNAEQVDPAQYYNEDSPTTITGATTGVTAKVIGFKAASTTDQPLLYVSYLTSGSDFETSVFADGENLSANTSIVHSTQTYATTVESITTYTSEYTSTNGASLAQLASAEGPASRTGLAYVIESGIYYIRGFFVNNLVETLVLNDYDENYTGTVGFKVTETIVTPENETDLLDNSTGSSNFAAKGAHRLSVSVALQALTSTTDTKDFISLLDVKNGSSRAVGRISPYNQIANEFARRTNDESGSYTIRPFEFLVSPMITGPDGGPQGKYTAGDITDDGNIASDDFVNIVVSPGKAYIKGYEIEKTQTTIKDLKKAVEFDTINASISTFDVGNFVFVSNVYGTPDITAISGETTAFNLVQFYDEFTSTRGSANGNLIGIGRVRAIEYQAGTVGTNEAQYKVYFFDIRPFTKLTLSDTPSPTLLASHSNGGVQLTGVTSGATGLVYASGTSGTSVNLTSVIGTFISGEELQASDSAEGDSGTIENSSNADLTITKVESFEFANFRQIYMEDADAGQDFTADLSLRSTLGLQSVLLEDSVTRADGTIITEGNEFIDQEGGVGRGLQDAEKNRAVYKLPKSKVKTLLTATNSGASDTQYTIRRQFIGTTNSSGVVTFTAGTNETFVSYAEKDYTLSILTAGAGSGVQGQLVTVDSKTAGTGTASLIVTDSVILGNAAKVKLTATLLKTSVIQKSKTVNLMKQVKVVAGATHAFGSRPKDKIISLGRADAFKLVAVFDSEDASTDAVIDQMTLTNQVGTFTRGERITGGTSSSAARTVDTSSPMSYILQIAIRFITGETITGASSGATATVGEFTEGSTRIDDSYLFDDGQRDNFYDISRLERKTDSPAPTGRLLIIYDYFEHGAGDLFTVDSYVDVGNRMGYRQIPDYTATKVDPTAARPSGRFPLRDTYDFRPRVEDIAGASSTLETIDEITGNSFDFYSRQYDGTGASTVDVCKPGSAIQSDLEFYLRRRSILVLDDRGSVIIIDGDSSENPQRPDSPVDVMKLADIKLNPFGFDRGDYQITRTRNQRFTMKDIGKMNERLTNVEKMTTLNLLERSAMDFEVTDANGLNRFKSGFMVDNFQGHRIGDTAHKDYNNSMDFTRGTLRPTHVSKSVDLEESLTTDSARDGAGYQKTGDLLTLPYTEVVLTEQPFASTVERVAPFMTATWKGVMEINPTQDNWMETDIAPQLIINTEGNYNAVTAAIGNNMGVVWNSWQTTWQGTVVRDDGMPPPPPQPVAQPDNAANFDPGGWGDDMGQDDAAAMGGYADTSGGDAGTGGGDGCVIATHGVMTGGFTLMEKAKAELWCQKTYHGKWYGEAFRTGYRAVGQRCIDKGKAPEHYQEFKDFVAYGRGVKKGLSLGMKYYARTIQFFIIGLFINVKNELYSL